MAVDGLKRMALAVGLMLAGVSGQAEPTSPRLPARPAPVSGRVSNDPAAVALRPAAAMPVVATSTARQVPPPSNPNEPLFKDEPAAAHVASTSAATGAGAGATPIPVSTLPAATPPASTSATKAATPAHAASAARGKPHVDHTKGKRLAESTKGHKKAGKVAGHEHPDKTGGAGRKKPGGHGKDAAVADKTHVSSAQARMSSSKHHAVLHPSGKAANLARHGKGAAHTAAKSPAQTVSTAHELKPSSARKHAAQQKTARKQAGAKARPHKTAELAQAEHKADKPGKRAARKTVRSAAAV